MELTPSSFPVKTRPEFTGSIGHHRANTLRTARPKQYYPYYVAGTEFRIPGLEWDSDRREWNILERPRKGEDEVYPIGDDGKERIWSLGHETARRHSADLKVERQPDGSVRILRKMRLLTEESQPSTWWDDARYSAVENGAVLIENILGKTGSFSFPKSVFATADCIQVCGVEKDSVVMDYFGGSGTTAHAVVNLNRQDGGKRKYVLVEMADYFDTVILPRIKKVVFCEKWKDGKAAGGTGVSHFVKYFQLEQYEDCLRRAKYEEADLFDDPNQDPYNQYVFLRDPKLLDAVKVDTKKNKVQVDLSRLYKGIDLPETLSNLTGKRIRRIKPDSVEFEDGTVIDLTKQDFEFFKLIKPMVWW